MKKAQQEVFNAEELAKLFGVSQRTIYRHTKKGHLPVIRLGRRLLFPKRAIFEWLKTTKLPNTHPTTTSSSPQQGLF